MASYVHDGLLLYLDGLVDWETYFRLRKGEGVDVAAEKAALAEVLRTTADLCREIEADSREHWNEAARLEGAEVVLPPHVQRGYERLCAAGLVSVGIEEEYGGFGLPSLLANMILEKVARANASLMTIVGLQAGVAEDIQKYASEDLKRFYLPLFTRGDVQGAMDLTEPQAGSDLGAIATRATREDDRWLLEGQKIFITNGGADVHLVLARDAESFEQSKGTTRGLSLYLCPLTLPGGRRNRVRVERLEHKLGLHGSPTAVVRFERAEAFLVGSRGEGFRAMLDLMNNARLGVAAQGIGIAEAALQEALDYARGRRQFGKPIGAQPLMKNMLSRMILALEGSRALLYRCAALVDRNRAIRACLVRDRELSELQRTELERGYERNQVQIRLMTPLAKYLATESCDQITRAAIQVHGGIGFMAETQAGRLHLDGIITTIYEGTSEIQVSFALKEIGKGALQILFEELHKELDGMSEPPLVEHASRVRDGIARINQSAVALLQHPSYALLCARHVAEMVISVVVATELLRQAQLAPRRFDLAAAWVSQRMLELEMRARRVSEGTIARIERCERIIRLYD